MLALFYQFYLWQNAASYLTCKCFIFWRRCNVCNVSNMIQIQNLRFWYHIKLHETTNLTQKLNGEMQSIHLYSNSMQGPKQKYEKDLDLTRYTRPNTTQVPLNQIETHVQKVYIKSGPLNGWVDFRPSRLKPWSAGRWAQWPTPPLYDASDTGLTKSEPRRNCLGRGRIDPVTS